MTNEQEMVATLRDIETLAILGSIPGTLTAITASMLASEIQNYHETLAEAMERAAAFVAMVKATV